MADFVVGLSKTVVEGALTKVQSAIEEDAKLRQRAQRDLVFISLEFEMMQSFLNVADEEGVKTNLMKTWVRHVRDLAFDLEDCFEFVVHLDNRSTWWYRLLPLCIAGPQPLDQAVTEIEQLKERVVEVSNCYTRYSHITDSGFKPVVLQQLPSGPAVSATASSILAEARDISKRPKGIWDLTQLITYNNFSVRELQVISVWGASGDHGTTSIIRKAYNDAEICQNFRHRAWVRLMHPFNPEEFIRCLMAQFYANYPSYSREKDEFEYLYKGGQTSGPLLKIKATQHTVGVDVLTKLKATNDHILKEYEEQVDQKYLIVVEDVSNMVEWDSIRTFLPNRYNGSWIIVSTQQSEVARLCVGHFSKPLELKRFSADHSVCAFFEEGYRGIEIQENIISGSDDVCLVDNKLVAKYWMEKSHLVGRESEIHELQKYADRAPTKCRNKRTESSPVMSVWGITGVGKSTLVRNLYYYKMLNGRQFMKYGWVDVTHPFNLRDFCRSFFSNISYEKDPIKKIRRLLHEYVCLIVIDDLRSKEEWDLIQAALNPRDAERSLIIVITTDASVATYCAGNEEQVFGLKGLEAKAAYDLFMKVSRNDPVPNSLSSEEKMKLGELLLKCGGLPRIITAVADLTAKKDGWMKTVYSISDRFMEHLETNPEFDMPQELFSWMHSYFRSCPDYLKPCILYLPIFPRGHNIRRRRLVRRWIAEGYARDGNEKSAEEEGEKFFSELLDMSIIEQIPHLMTSSFNDTRMVLCHVNGFIREYILSREMEENLVFKLGGSCSVTTQRTGRHLTILEDWDRERVVFRSIDFSRLRSFTVFGEWKSFLISKSMKLLRVLDLENSTGVSDEDLQQMVNLFTRLKFLSLRGCSSIFNLPSSLGDLRQLQSLDVRHTFIATLPTRIAKLQKLQYIRAGKPGPAKAPLVSSWLSKFSRRCHIVGVVVPRARGIEEWTSLHTLGDINVSASEGETLLEEIQKLTQLLKLGVSGINRKNSEKLFSAISGHVHLESLSVRLDTGNEDCLNGISLPTKAWENLQSLKLYGLLDKFPNWSNQLSKLRKLDLEMTTLMQEGIEFLGKLPKLCILRLHVNQPNDGTLHFCVVPCPSYEKVKILEIACSSSIHVTFGSETMKNLKLLEVVCGGESSYKFSGLDDLSELKEVLLKGTHDETFRAALQTKLEAHPMKPVVKLEVPPRSS